ncbi:MAG TPA: DinB family protein [Pyrinomonadaceae bacterium]|nr:DinB family protein [Pyrinomonadaceae bacterium]
MEFQLEEARQILSRTPLTLNSLLLPLSNAWLLRNEGAETWSPFDVVGHLIHGEETDWIPRTKVILQHGEGRPFEPFDRFAMFERSKGKSITELLDTFTRLREANLQELDEMKLTAADLEKRGRHPELGTVTLKQLLATWVAHDLGHVAQIVRVMAKQYREEVGPWRQYLSIVNR